jgi:hypothetical protein
METLQQFKDKIEQLPEFHTKEQIMEMIHEMKNDVEEFCKINNATLPIKNATTYFSERHMTLFLSYNMIFHMILRGKLNMDVIDKLLDCRDKIKQKQTNTTANFKSKKAAEGIMEAVDILKK